MERRLIGYLAAAAATTFLLFSLAACNPIDIEDSIKTSVMEANKKFLMVNQAFPAKNEQSANPGEPIWLEFDRSIDTDTITADAIKLSPAATWTAVYNDTTKILSIQPDALAGLTNYTVTVTKSLKGKDKSTLQNEYAWAFHTLNLPGGNIKINNGALSTTSNTVTLNITYNAATTSMRYSMTKSDITNDTASWIAANPTVSSYNLSGQPGANTVYIQFRDSLDNRTNAVTPIHDGIIYGAPSGITATMNTTARGTVNVGWSAMRQDIDTNYYYVYRKDYPSQANATLIGPTTATSLSVSVPQGQLYYFYVVIYNPSAGLSVSTECPLGYTSDIAVVYNSGDTADTTAATSLKTLLTTNIPGTYGGVTGTMPTWTVTLIPQSAVSTTYAAANIFYGWPVIVTPGITFYGNANQVRNVIGGGHGVIAMGAGGVRLLDTVSANYSTWGYTDQVPNEIGWGPSASGITTNCMYTWTNGNSTWSYPLQSTTFTGALPTAHNARTQISYASWNRYSVYRGSDTNPTGGWIFGRDDQTSGHYYPVVRQGRFLQFGFDGVTDRYYTGWVYITNLVYRMGATYY